MKKLEDIPKKDPFKAPEGYFDKLPGLIQARIAKPERPPVWVPVLKFAVPVVVLITAGVFWFSNPTPQNIEAELASIGTEQLTAYLENSGPAWDDAEDNVDWSEFDLRDLEDRVYATFTTDGAELDLLEDEVLILENF